MFGIGICELGILVIFLGIVIAVIGLATKGFKLPKLGHAKLNCPHCGAETPANQDTCQACGKELS